MSGNSARNAAGRLSGCRTTGQVQPAQELPQNRTPYEASATSYEGVQPRVIPVLGKIRVKIVDTGLCTRRTAVPDWLARLEQLKHLTTVQFKQTARPSAAAYERPLKLNPAQRG
jgi:hypothetical protein